MCEYSNITRTQTMVPKEDKKSEYKAGAKKKTCPRVSKVTVALKAAGAQQQEEKGLKRNKYESVIGFTVEASQTIKITSKSGLHGFKIKYENSSYVTCFPDTQELIFKTITCVYRGNAFE